MNRLQDPIITRIERFGYYGNVEQPIECQCCGEFISDSASWEAWELNLCEDCYLERKEEADEEMEAEEAG